MPKPPGPLCGGPSPLGFAGDRSQGNLSPLGPSPTSSISRDAANVAVESLRRNTTSTLGSHEWLKSEAARYAALPDVVAPIAGHRTLPAAGDAAEGLPSKTGEEEGGGSMQPTRNTLMCSLDRTETNQSRSSSSSSARSAAAEAAAASRCALSATSPAPGCSECVGSTSSCSSAARTAASRACLNRPYSCTQGSG